MMKANPQINHLAISSKPNQVQIDWSDHILTLIVYEARYVNNKKDEEEAEDFIVKRPLDKEQKKKKKQMQEKYETGFLHVSPHPSEDFQVSSLIGKYQCLKELWEDKTELKQNLKLKNMIMRMLEVKHSEIVHEFCGIYNRILLFINQILFEEIIGQEQRNSRIEKIKQNIVSYIQENQKQFSFFCSYLQESQIETKKLIYVTIYCFLAEKFSFHINEHYHEAFPVEGSFKKVKKE